jgi:hypothetical protein
MLGGSLALSAQKRSIVHTSQQWVQFYTQTEVSEKMSLLLDVGMRQTHNGMWPTQRLIRAGVAFGLPMKLRGATALARLISLDEGHTSRLEWRLSQDLARTDVIRGIQWQHRLRLEARFLHARVSSGNEWQDHFNMRYRYRLQAMLPLVTFGDRKNDPPRLLLSVANEMFVNSGKEIIHNTFDNNRFVIGPVVRLNPTLSFAMLYNHQFGHRSQRNTAESSEICWLTVNWKGRWKASDKSGRLQ